MGCSGPNNLIPIEIALKIANKIYANERFLAYIVVPMWPEAEDTPSASSESFSSSNPQIFGYRMSLWAEHIGAVEESFTRPESLECMRQVWHIGEQNWEQFVSNKVTKMRGHLLKYPVSVDRVGQVKPPLDCAAFPDLGGNICGSFLHIQENLTI
ncbi:hypothetical protein PR202_ga26549 [Eleusine coracana subsp. coracana]|uniref:Phospholipase D C-terminal domain-containing protein n=1 Tax=Eleusine coracana subsp. coracana TaxID=191504 RepID=A0AAV5DEF3_ELECO|nr:hypothetical protein PR202_ga26549 [Eleusine coracana subsp. coracana]